MEITDHATRTTTVKRPGAPDEVRSRRVPVTPWLGLYVDPRCEEVITLHHGQIVRRWSKGDPTP